MSPEYLADTCPSSGEPLLMLVSWGTHSQNVEIDSRVSFTVRDVSWMNGTERCKDWRRKRVDSVTKNDRGTMDHARLTLVGHLVRVTQDEVRSFLMLNHS